MRPVWLLDRLCGSQLYWQTFFEFGTEKDQRGEQFSLAMNYVFEDSVGYLFRRVAIRARPTITLITESQLQQAWTRGGQTPSVCDWVLASGKYCLLVDATNHWLDEKAAQGFADTGDYWSDTEDTFVNKKFLQLKSTMQLLDENGWDGCKFDDETSMFLWSSCQMPGFRPTCSLMSTSSFVRIRCWDSLETSVVTSPGILIYRVLINSNNLEDSWPPHLTYPSART